MTPFWKTLTFWISACSWFVVIGGHYVGAIPAPYGLVASNFIAVIYAVLRCLQKRQAGIPWKAILFTSEFAVTTLTVLVDQLESIKQIPSLPPKVLGIVSGGIAGLLFLLHALAGGRSPLGTAGLPTHHHPTFGNLAPLKDDPRASDTPSLVALHSSLDAPTQHEKPKR